MPFGEPGADWLLIGPAGQDIQLRHTAYDLVRAAERIRATAYPMAEDFAARYVLQPPSAAEMLELFTRASMVNASPGFAIPLAQSLWWSFTDFNGYSSDAQFVGFRNDFQPGLEAAYVLPQPAAKQPAQP